MRRRRSLAKCLFNCKNASLITDSMNRNFVNDRRLLMTALCCLRSLVNGGESGSEKKKTLRLKLHSMCCVSTFICLCVQELLFSCVIDFFLTYADPKFVYKLLNYKTVSNDKDISNLFNWF